MVGTLSNRQIDAYLARKVKGFIIIPSASYQEFFAYDGSIINPSLKNAVDTMKDCAFCVNTDRRDGPGQHWVAICIFPKLQQIFYYDSLLPNKEYRLSHEIAMFIVRMTNHGFVVYQNVMKDQGNTFGLPDGKRTMNDMCGAYAAQLIVLMDRVITKNLEPVMTFFDSRDVLRNSSYVYHVYLKMI